VGVVKESDVPLNVPLPLKVPLKVEFVVLSILGIVVVGYLLDV
jgi:hypothetical protein